MRQQLVQLLESSEQDMFEEVALRCFWSRPRPLPAAPPSTRDPGGVRSEARVIDLVQWTWQRGKGTRP
jgi:hypothetical protein